MLDLKISCIWCRSEERNHACVNPFVVFASSSPNHIKHCLLGKEQLNEAKAAAGSIFYLKQGVLRVDLGFSMAQTSELLYPGEFFTAELMLNTGMNRKIAAASEAVVCELTCQVLRSYVLQSPSNMNGFMEGYGVFMSRFRETLYERTFVPLRARFIKAIYRDLFYRGNDYLGELVATRIFTHQDWARCLGARRESVSRLFTEFERTGLVRLTDSHIHLPDPSAFAAEAKQTAPISSSEAQSHS